MEYSELLSLQSDDTFWNDGTFTNANEPWATDEATKKGIRQLSYFKRSIEERRRLGWETRRAMRWVIERHQLLKTMLQTVLRLLRNPEALPIPQDIQNLLEHAQNYVVVTDSMHMHIYAKQNTPLFVPACCFQHHSEPTFLTYKPQNIRWLCTNQMNNLIIDQMLSNMI
ncbi:hypothetical protein PtB15_8B794 [Puccinia triticina]|nr:hypothetical protein PtB15_8B794 [Puccinia triticina]